jgi:hypothetical protein
MIQSTLTMYSGLSLKRTLPPKVTSFSRSDFQYTMIVNTTNLLLSRKASPLERTLFHYRRGGLSREELL